MKLTYACISERGPRPVNEDAIGVWQLGDSRLLAAVADGLGGMGGGDLASTIAISHLGGIVEQVAHDPSVLLTAAQTIHEEIRKQHQDATHLRGMATTLSAVFLSHGKLVGVHCGDTRVLVARGRGIKRLTRDHSEAARFYEEGKISLSEYRAYPRKNVLYSALGAAKPPEIQTFEFEVEIGDWIVLASDGVHQRIATRHLRDLAKAVATPEQFSAGLLEEIKIKGATDNFSAVIVHIQ